MYVQCSLVAHLTYIDARNNETCPSICIGFKSDLSKHVYTICMYLNRCSRQNEPVISSELFHCFGDLRNGREYMYMYIVRVYIHICISIKRCSNLCLSVLNDVSFIQNAVVPCD